MFTGIVEAVGEVMALAESTPGTYRLEIRTPLSSELKIGDSLANNGVCLTVISQAALQVGFDLLAETVLRSNLKDLKIGDLVNLERPMAASGRFDGHIVQGHVDTTAKLLVVTEAGQDHRIEVELPVSFQQYLVFKGSIAVNGISLTVAEMHPDRFVIWIIPHTWKMTNLHRLKRGDDANLEFDIIAKYIERMISGRQNTGAGVQGSRTCDHTS
jgi:riboflavin synthase